MQIYSQVYVHILKWTYNSFVSQKQAQQQIYISLTSTSYCW